MKEKIKRILDLIRGGKLTLDDAAPLLAALHTRLALQTTDRELLDSLLKRDDLDTAQVAEHLLLLRGLKDTPPTPPQPPRPPGPPFEGVWADRSAGRAERSQTRGRPYRSGGIEGMVERITDTVERAVETAMEGVERTVTGKSNYSYDYAPGNPASRILKIEIESNEGDDYNANIPISLAGHLDKLIPPYGLKALERAGFTLQGLQLLIEAEPPSGHLIQSEDNLGNSISISIK